MAAYIIARINVTDPQEYMKYASQTVALAEKAGGKFLVKGGDQTYAEGNGPDRHVLIEFPTKDMALAWYNSAEYQEILPIALRSSTRDIVVVEGV